MLPRGAMELTGPPSQLVPELVAELVQFLRRTVTMRCGYDHGQKAQEQVGHDIAVRNVTIAIDRILRERGGQRVAHTLAVAVFAWH